MGNLNADETHCPSQGPAHVDIVFNKQEVDRLNVAGIIAIPALSGGDGVELTVSALHWFFLAHAAHRCREEG